MSGNLNSQFIGLDFDGTVTTHDFPRIGKDIGAIPVIKLLVENNHKIILNTMRSGPELIEAVNYLIAQGIKLDGINENKTQKRWTSSPKVYAHVYIDDAGLGMPLSYDARLSDRPFVDWYATENLLRLQGFIKTEDDV